MARSIVLVTGGNNGIGLETCSRFIQQPSIHVIMGSRSREKGEKAVSELQKGSMSGTLSLVQLDVNSDDSIAAAVKEVQQKHGRLDTLINNAGICPTTTSRETFREAFEANSISPAMVTRAFAPLLEKSAAPRVIYVSSGLGSIARRFDTSISAYNEDYKVYRMSKAAVNMLAACEAWEYKEKNFKVFSYCPGFVLSDLGGMRQAKIDRGVPGPENSARGLLAIHEGGQDGNAQHCLSDRSVLQGEAFTSW